MPLWNHLRRFTAVVALLLVPAVATAAVPHLVKDLNPAGASSDPQIALEANGLVYFVATDAAGGKALWATDGTVAGSVRLTDLPSGAYWDLELTAVGGAVFFLNVADGVIELWRTDGTAGGTARVATLPAAYYNGSQLAKNLTAVGPTLFFSVFAAGSGWNLWTSDGTEGGTTLVAAIDANVQFIDFVDFGGVAYFAATDANGTELWRSDGTAAGTEPVADLNPGPASSYPQEFIVMNGLLYFTATDAATGFEIWSSDGTAAGTARIGDVNPGPANLVSGPFTTMNGMLFFQGYAPGIGATLWGSDGTAAGTIPLGGGYPSNLTPVNGTLFFSAYDAAAGHEPWKSDGTPAGTMRIADVRPGTLESAPTGFHAFGGLVYFAAYLPETGFELWRTNGTAAGTAMVTDLVPGFGASQPGGLTDVAGRLLFAAYGPSGRELWQSNGTAAGTSLFFDPTPPGSGSSSLHELVATGGRLAFLRDATDGTAAPTVWTSDGSAPGTSQATALIGRAIADWSGTLVIAGGTTDNTSYGLWTRSPAGAVHQIYSGYAGSPTIAAGKLFFSDGSRALVSDGTPGAAVALATIPGPTGCTFNHCITFDSFPRSFVHLGGGAVVFLAFAQNGWELWRTDGTPGGTSRIASVGLGIAYDYGTFESRLMNGRLYFAASDAATGLELWSTDGTAAGTVRVADIEPGTAGSSPAGFTVLDGRLYFAATDAAAGRELWSSDGTAAGTARVVDLEPGAGSSDPRDLTVFAGALYFGASEASTGRELWRSDGTAAGTTLVLDIAPGDADGAPTALAAYGSSLLFSADDGVHGAELWTSDGTPGGTALLADIDSGPHGSAPSAFTAAGNDLFFLAYTPERGTELWALAVASACGNGVVDAGENCDDGNAVPGDGCDQDCISELCGDGVLDPGEQCDDANRVDGDGCSAACLLDCGVTPASGCHEPIVAGGARVLLKNVAGTKDQVQWKWAKGTATLKSEFGAPLATSGFAFCVYDATGAALTANARAGGVCGAKPCWRESATGFSYKRATADGLLQFSLHAGAAGKAKITLKARGDAFTMPSLAAMTSPLTVQLRTGGACWSATYSVPFGGTTGTLLKDASD